MRVHVNKIPDIVQEFVLSNIVTGAPTDLAKFATGFFAPYVADAVKGMLQGPLATSLGVVGSDGMVDIDRAYASASASLEKTGGTLSVYGLIFRKDDLDTLNSIAKKYGGQ